MAEMELTPMMQQYQRVKREIPPDALLLFRLGDFYEMFFDDAKAGAQLLNLALTSRNKVPMCGIPYHAAESYIARLLRHGRKVAICDQIEEARPGKLVQREVTQIVSPGAHFDARMLHANQHNFLAAITNHDARYGFALADLTTGDFRVTELDSEEQLQTEIERLNPSEIIVPSESLQALKHLGTQALTAYDDWTFEHETAYFTLRDHFKTGSAATA
jgi:DNA mismatch repair protein MutS